MKQLKLKAFYPHLFAIILLILIGLYISIPRYKERLSINRMSSFVGAAKRNDRLPGRK